MLRVIFIISLVYHNRGDIECPDNGTIVGHHSRSMLTNFIAHIQFDY